jgi:hypothetical protein
MPTVEVIRLAVSREKLEDYLRFTCSRCGTIPRAAWAWRLQAHLHEPGDCAMKRELVIVIGAIAAASIPAIAKLPAPTPEERAASEEKQLRQEQQLKKDKAALERAQNRVAERYRATQPRDPSARTDPGTLPKTARELPGDAGPQGDREPSAEAHSAPAK